MDPSGLHNPEGKMKFLAYKDSGFQKADKGLEFEVQFNPAELGYSYRLEYNNEQPQNATNTPMNFKKSSPAGLTLNFIIDGTGAAGTQFGMPDVKQKVDDLFKVVVNYQGDTHRPRYVMVLWGKMIFKGVTETINVKYNLFSPSGKPLRAKIDMSLSSALSYEKQVAENSPESADMTHHRTVHDGDNLPLFSYDIYKYPEEYIKVARFNNIVNFRRLVAGQKIVFPPLIDKDNTK